MTSKIHPAMLGNKKALELLQLVNSVLESNSLLLKVAVAISEEPFTSMNDKEICIIFRYKRTKLRNIRAMLNLAPEVLEHIKTHTLSISLDFLVEIQKLPNTIHMEVYKKCLDHKLGRDDLREMVRAHKPYKEPKTPMLIPQVRLGYTIDYNIVSDDEREDFEKKLAEFLAKYKSACGSETK